MKTAFSMAPIAIDTGKPAALPHFLPAPMHKMLPVLQLQFSVTQLITAVIGGVYAVIIAAVLKKTSLAQAD
jgi:hypothetical protein